VALATMTVFRAGLTGRPPCATVEGPRQIGVCVGGGGKLKHVYV
jgi:hypothetical protein